MFFFSSVIFNPEAGWKWGRGGGGLEVTAEELGGGGQRGPELRNFSND